MLDTLTINKSIEIAAVLANIAYVILLMYERKSCWFFGVLGSALSIFLFYRIHLYAETALYVFYVGIGIYGWVNWNQKLGQNKLFSVTKWPLIKHLPYFICSLILSVLMGYGLTQYTDAENAYFDAFTTVFSLWASYLETQKVLAAWAIWIIVNSATVFLYYGKGVDMYALLTCFYVGSSFVGFYKWNKMIGYQ